MSRCCEHTTYQHGADGCNAADCPCARMSWCEEDDHAIDCDLDEDCSCDPAD